MVRATITATFSFLLFSIMSCSHVGGQKASTRVETSQITHCHMTDDYLIVICRLTTKVICGPKTPVQTKGCDSVSPLPKITVKLEAPDEIAADVTRVDGWVRFSLTKPPRLPERPDKPWARIYAVVPPFPYPAVLFSPPPKAFLKHISESDNPEDIERFRRRFSSHSDWAALERDLDAILAQKEERRKKAELAALEQERMLKATEQKPEAKKPVFNMTPEELRETLATQCKISYKESDKYSGVKKRAKEIWTLDPSVRKVTVSKRLCSNLVSFFEAHSYDLSKVYQGVDNSMETQGTPVIVRISPFGLVVDVRFETLMGVGKRSIADNFGPDARKVADIGLNSWDFLFSIYAWKVFIQTYSKTPEARKILKQWNHTAKWYVVCLFTRKGSAIMLIHHLSELIQKRQPPTILVKHKKTIRIHRGDYLDLYKQPVVDGTGSVTILGLIKKVLAEVY